MKNKSGKSGDLLVKTGQKKWAFLSSLYMLVFLPEGSAKEKKGDSFIKSGGIFLPPMQVVIPATATKMMHLVFLPSD